jgi:hypothetical protein
LKGAPHLPAASWWGAFPALLFFAQISNAQQIETSVDIGLAALRYADTLNATTVSVTPRLFGDWKSLSIDASGGYSQFTSGGSSLQGTISASRFFAVRDGIAAELGGLAGGSSHSDGTRTGEILANARLHVGRSSGELFTGAALGRACYGGSCPTLVLAEFGGSFEVGPASALVSVNPAMVSDSITYADAQTTFSWSREQLEIGAVFGHRFGDALTVLSADTRTWASVTASRWIVPRIALVASGGTYPIDPTQGFPGGRFVSLAVRVKTGVLRGTHPSESGRGVEVQDSDHVPAAIAEFKVDRGPSGTVRFTANTAGAKLVEISGDFTKWEPVRLVENALRPGEWSLVLPIERGKYQMNVRVNGGQWVVPPGLLPMADEFGGAVGLLVIE